jgi:hypothetical protein
VIGGGVGAVGKVIMTELGENTFVTINGKEGEEEDF